MGDGEKALIVDFYDLVTHLKQTNLMKEAVHASLSLGLQTGTNMVTHVKQKSERVNFFCKCINIIINAIAMIIKLCRNVHTCKLKKKSFIWPFGHEEVSL